jgi:hypothetical protein
MDMRGHLGGGLLGLTKHADGTAVGQFLTTLPNISFMGLRPSADALATLAFPKAYQRLPIQETAHLTSESTAYACAAHFATYEQFRGQDNDLNLWLQWILPSLSIKWKGSPDHLHAVLSDETTRTVATIEPQAQHIQITVYGQRPLWSEILFAYRQWLQAAKPARDSYTLHIDLAHRHQVMHMHHQHLSHTFPLA